MIRTHTVRVLAVGLILTSAIVATTACGDDEDSEGPTATPPATRTAAPLTPQSTPEPNATSSGETIEVQGVVGAVDARAGIIEIRATGGSSVTTIELAPGAEIKSPNGATLQLADIHPSDRIVASGVPGAGPEILVADVVTAQQVVPGGPPGANPGG
jgi:hypothetical protein